MAGDPSSSGIICAAEPSVSFNRLITRSNALFLEQSAGLVTKKHIGGPHPSKQALSNLRVLV